MLRNAWGLGQQPIRNMIHLLEAKGVRVFSLAVDAREVDAFSMWKGNSPFIFLNGHKSSEHSRYDAAHELGHLVLHKHGGPRGREAEIEANRFASAFLMPRGSVLGYAPRAATMNDLIRLKRIWVTSVAALNHRLHEVGLLSNWHYQRLCIEISKRGYRVSEPEEAPRETSLVLPQLLASLWADDKMSRSDIATVLQIPLPELENLFFAFVLTGINGGRRGQSMISANTQLSRVK
jgi:Zn-dependent peptidase ImmA (M78 family)